MASIYVLKSYKRQISRLEGRHFFTCFARLFLGLGAKLYLAKLRGVVFSSPPKAQDNQPQKGSTQAPHYWTPPIREARGTHPNPESLAQGQGSRPSGRTPGPHHTGHTTHRVHIKEKRREGGSQRAKEDGAVPHFPLHHHHQCENTDRSLEKYFQGTLWWAGMVHVLNSDLMESHSFISERFEGHAVRSCSWNKRLTFCWMGS